FYASLPFSYLYSFPTRRSSDLDLPLFIDLDSFGNAGDRPALDGGCCYRDRVCPRAVAQSDRLLDRSFARRLAVGGSIPLSSTRPLDAPVPVSSWKASVQRAHAVPEYSDGNRCVAFCPACDLAGQLGGGGSKCRRRCHCHLVVHPHRYGDIKCHLTQGTYLLMMDLRKMDDFR